MIEVECVEARQKESSAGHHDAVPAPHVQYGRLGADRRADSVTGRRLVAVAGVVLVVAVAAAVWLTTRSETDSATGFKPTAATGPSTETEPYVLPVADGVHIRSLLTVEDEGSASNGYELGGIPDGLGAVAGSGGDFTLFMNHEFDSGAGVERRHGQRGAYVSTFTIDRETFEVKAGSDTIDPGVRYWNYVTGAYQETGSPEGRNPRKRGDVFAAQGDALARLCSATLSALEQFVSRDSGRGYSGQIYFANEEYDPDGRVFGVLPDGTSQQLPRLGLFAWENTKPAYNRSDTTLVIGNEDTAHGQLHIYEGAKQDDGDPFDRAGLTNGARYVLDLVDEKVSSDAEFRDAFGKGAAAEFDLAEVVWDQSGARQNDEAEAEGLTLFRIEDGTWDPRRPETFYFTTTEGGAGASRERDGGGLWKLTFEDIEQPRRGGTIELLLDGSEAPHLNAPDNVDIDASGNLLIQEDPDENPHLARIVAYDTATGARGVVARFDPERFGADSANLITIDEEASGIIDAQDVIGPGWFLFDAQMHERSADPANVELGQLLAMKVDSFQEIYDIP
jgi:hypothetical protein